MDDPLESGAKEADQRDRVVHRARVGVLRNFEYVKLHSRHDEGGHQIVHRHERKCPGRIGHRLPKDPQEAFEIIWHFALKCSKSDLKVWKDAFWVTLTIKLFQGAPSLNTVGA